MENMMKKKHEIMSYPMARAYLGRVKAVEQKVKLLEMRIENMRLLLTGTSVQLSDMPRSDSPDQEKMATLYAEIDELEREKAQAEAEAESIRIEVGRMICRLSDPLAQKVLMLYYLEHLNWRAVTENAHLCISQVYQHRDQGYAELEKSLTEHVDIPD